MFLIRPTPAPPPRLPCKYPVWDGGAGVQGWAGMIGKCSKPMPAWMLFWLWLGVLPLPVYGHGGIAGDWSASYHKTGDICADALIAAAKRHGVPQSWALALGITEAGRARADGKLRIWPWTLNIAGKGRYFASRRDAENALEAALATGERVIDAGCAQINWHWHHGAFDSAAELLDPQRNADYAMRYLASHYQGAWDTAIARYHSGTPRLGEAYLARVLDNKNALNRLSQQLQADAKHGAIALWSRLEATQFTLPAAERDS